MVWDQTERNKKYKEHKRNTLGNFFHPGRGNLHKTRTVNDKKEST